MNNITNFTDDPASDGSQAAMRRTDPLKRHAEVQSSVRWFLKAFSQPHDTSFDP